jgi:hypothetical protein
MNRIEIQRKRKTNIGYTNKKTSFIKLKKVRNGLFPKIETVISLNEIDNNKY